MNKFRLCAFADEASSDISEQIKALKENQIEFIELRGVNGKSVSDLSVKEAKELKNRFDSEGIGVWSIGSPIGKISITDDFKPHFELFLRTLETAAIMEASCFRLFSFYIPQGDNPALYRDEVMTRLSAFCEAAKGSNVILCHENEKDIYGDVAERCLDIHKSIPELKGIFDPANFIQCGQEIKSAWEMLYPYIYYLHIKDALADGTVVPAGAGIGEIQYILEKYGEINGDMLTVEPHLSVFEGLDKLGREERKAIGVVYKYSSQREAFDAAVKALRAFL